ncbi:hypothetical protein K438DRAFT_1767909 [Mycena galopus ATCC 62051]|nr:hypothetical protein K438DRAFT_1767909 [Mycena galopus ATCC 62051]
MSGWRSGRMRRCAKGREAGWLEFGVSGLLEVEVVADNGCGIGMYKRAMKSGRKYEHSLQVGNSRRTKQSRVASGGCCEHERKKDPTYTQPPETGDVALSGHAVKEGGLEQQDLNKYCRLIRRKIHPELGMERFGLEDVRTRSAGIFEERKRKGKGRTREESKSSVIASPIVYFPRPCHTLPDPSSSYGAAVMSLHSPSLGPSSPSPSSSAVTIPIPGKSILKKPPPAQAGLFSGSLSKLSGGLSRFFPGERDASALSSSGFGNSASGSGNTGGNSGGNGAGGKEKEKDAEAARNTPSTHPRTVGFSGVRLTSTTASILADMLNIEWGLHIKECNLDELFPRLPIGFLSSGFPPRPFLSPFRFNFGHVSRLRRGTHPHGSTRSTTRMRVTLPYLGSVCSDPTAQVNDDHIPFPAWREVDILVIDLSTLPSTLFIVSCHPIFFPSKSKFIVH